MDVPLLEKKEASGCWKWLFRRSSSEQESIQQVRERIRAAIHDVNASAQHTRQKIARLREQSKQLVHTNKEQATLLLKEAYHRKEIYVRAITYMANLRIMEANLAEGEMFIQTAEVIRMGREAMQPILAQLNITEIRKEMRSLRRDTFQLQRVGDELAIPQFDTHQDFETLWDEILSTENAETKIEEENVEPVLQISSPKKMAEKTVKKKADLA